MKKALGWGATIVLAIGGSAVASLFDRHTAIVVGKYSTLYVLLVTTYFVFHITGLKNRVLTFRALYGRGPGMSFGFAAFVGVCIALAYWYEIDREFKKHFPDHATAAAQAELPKPLPVPTPISLDELAAAIAGKISKPSPPAKEPHMPASKLPRVGSGPDAYKEIDDLQIVQWANEEADKIEELADHWNDGWQGASVNSKIWRFSEKFKDCCAQEVKDLREEMLRRLGPPAKDPAEVTAWTAMFPEEKYGFGPSNINPQSAKYYAPYLRLMALRLKRRTVPRFTPKNITFTETQAPPEGKFTHRIIATIEPKEVISKGYVVVEFDKPIAMVGTDFPGVSIFDLQFIDNKEFASYYKSLLSEHIRFYAFGIGKTPFRHGTPIHILAAGSGDVSFHVSKVTVFDE